MSKPTESQFDQVINGYLACLLWVAPGDEDDENPGDGTSVHELSYKVRLIAAMDCQAFIEACGSLFDEAVDARGYSLSRFGHDFALTRNGHGAGFWDRSELKDGGLGDKLSALCGFGTRFKENNLYKGDDGRFHLESGAS